MDVDVNTYKVFVDVTVPILDLPLQTGKCNLQSFILQESIYKTPCQHGSNGASFQVI